MNHETEIRVNLAKMYPLLADATPEQMEKACEKLEEAVLILKGLPLPVRSEEEKKVHG
jgi:hypothetical protein